MKLRYVVSLLTILAFAGTTFAMPTDEYLAKYRETRENTRNGTLGPLAESFELVALLIEWTAQRAADAVAQTNKASPLGGGINYAFYDPAVTTIETLSYYWLDCDTLDPVASPIGISSVLYEVDDDPDLNVFEFLGISTDPMSNFSLSYEVSGFEPIIRATPLDSGGMPISVIDLDGSEIAQGYAMSVVPEPTTVALLGLGGLVLLRRRRG